MRLLLKYPTRSRPGHFLARLREWLSMSDSPQLLSFVVSYDHDDATMTPGIVQEAERLHPALCCYSGHSDHKIHAINRDMDKAGDWDIVLVISDDFFPRRKGWDSLIRNEMAIHFPDTDGSLWIYDGAQRNINTLPCLGRKFYERFGYIYHPSYSSFFCDDEQTAVGLALGKLARVNTEIATHEHPSWCGGMKRDELYSRNNKYWTQDKDNFARRKAAGFP